MKDTTPRSRSRFYCLINQDSWTAVRHDLLGTTTNFWVLRLMHRTRELVTFAIKKRSIRFTAF